MKNNILITICGRAGSKGFKNKNLKIFLGEPLVYYSLSAALLFKEQVKEEADVDICLNTDSSELRDIVLKKYPEVNYIARTQALGTDKVPKAAVWRNCINIMQLNKKKKYSYMIDLDITSPLRQVQDILGAYKLKLSRPDADMVESVCYSRRNPYFNMLKDEGDYASTVIDSNYTTRQEAPAIYDENASIYVLDTRFFDENDSDMLNRAKTIVYIMKDTAVLDIDSEDDFLMMSIIGNYLYDNVPEYSAIQECIRK